MWLEQDNQDEQNKPLNTSVGAGGGGPLGGSTPSGANPSTISPVQTNKPQQNFATIQDYLGANKPQGEDLGQKVTSALGTTYSGEKNAIDTAATQTQNDINAGTVKYDPNLVSEATTTPSTLTGNPDQLGSFLKQWNASYTGPSSFESMANYNPAASAVNEAQGKAAETATPGGQETLLGEQFGVVGQGNRNLDQALLQESSAFPTVQDQNKQFASLPDYLQQKASETNALIAPAQTTAQTTQNQTRADFATGLSNLGSTVEANKRAIAGSTGEELRMLPTNPTDDDLARVGMSRGDYNAIAASAGPSIKPYQQSLSDYLAAQQLQKQAIASQF